MPIQPILRRLEIFCRIDRDDRGREIELTLEQSYGDGMRLLSYG